jgi:hypothetical protein
MHTSTHQCSRRSLSTYNFPFKCLQVNSARAAPYPSEISLSLARALPPKKASARVFFFHSPHTLIIISRQSLIINANTGEWRKTQRANERQKRENEKYEIPVSFLVCCCVCCVLRDERLFKHGCQGWSEAAARLVNVNVARAHKHHFYDNLKRTRMRLINFSRSLISTRTHT